MDEIKKLDSNSFDEIVIKRRFVKPLLTKDYYLTLILYLIKDIEGMYFKGGTALNKIFLSHARLSEDIDFTLIRNEREIKTEIIELLNKTNLFVEIIDGKNVDGFIRLIVKYKSELGEGEIFIDLNKREKLFLPIEIHNVKHFYEEFIPRFLVKTLAKEELIAEKVAAAIGRNKPRDHFDIYMILKEKLPLNMKLVEKKCLESGDEFSIIKMFNRAQKLKKGWDEDMLALISEPITFEEVMKSLAKHFKLKEEKERLKSV